MKQYICDSAGAVNSCAQCLGGRFHLCEDNSSFHCPDVGHQVRCIPATDPREILHKKSRGRRKE